MSNIKTILEIDRAVKRGATFLSFDYKKENGEISRRNLLVNVDIEKAQAKRGKPLKNVGNWQTGNSAGRNGCFVEREGNTYVRGFEGGKVLKIFKVAAISNLECKTKA